MAYDLKIAEHGDILFSPTKDLLGVAGHSLVEQRIRNRLIIRRGSWLYDTDNVLGSQLHSLIGSRTDEAAERVQMIVHDALRPMEDISITNVVAADEERGLVLYVQYELAEIESDYPAVPYYGTAVVEVPIGG